MWYRVNDPLSPLSGCDVRGRLANFEEAAWENLSAGSFLIIDAVRRVDVFQGDRPYQRVAADGQNLGLLIAESQLVESPIQDDVVEIATDRPYGAVVEERDHDRSDGLALRVVEYESMAQVALDDTSSGTVLGSATVSLDNVRLIEEQFVGGGEVDEMLSLLAVSGV